MAHEVARVVLAAQGLVVKHVYAFEVRIVAAEVRSSRRRRRCRARRTRTTSENLVSIWLPHGLLKEMPEGRKHAREKKAGGREGRCRSR
jgi:hypothetical protein